MSDEQYRQMVRSGLAPLVKDVPKGPEWDDLIADDIVMAAPAPPRKAPGWLIGLAMAAAVLMLVGLAVVLSPSAPPSTTGPVATAPPTTTGEDSPTTSLSSGSPGLFPVTLGVDHVWPETPSQLSPVELAELFVEETLGWESAVGTESSDAVPDGPAWVRVQQPGVEELVDVLTVPSSDGGRVIVEVGTPWERGVAISPMEPEGTRVSLLRIVGSVQGDVTIRLSDGRQVVASTPIDLSSSDPLWVTFPDVNPVLVRSVLVRYVDEDGTVVAATGGSQPDLTSTASFEFDEPPVLDVKTGTRVYFSTDNRLTEVDIDAASVAVYEVPELAPGDPLYRLVRRGQDFVFYGETDTGPAVFALDPAAPTSPVLIDEAWFFIPSAVEDRIWLAILDESSPSTVRALQSVREVTVKGQVTVEDVPPPDGRWPIAAVNAGLIFQGEETLEVWNPEAQEVIETLPGPFAVATWQNQIVACGRCNQLELIDLDTATQRTVDLPPEVGSVDGYGGAFSPDGRYMAVPGFLSGGQQITQDTGVGVVLVDFESGTASLVPGMSHPLNGYPQVAWSPDGEWLFYSVGGLYADTGQLFAYHPGDPTAYEVTVTLDGQYYDMTTE